MKTIKQLFSFYGNDTRLVFWLTQLGVFIGSLLTLFSIGIARHLADIDPNSGVFITTVFAVFAAGGWIGWATVVKRCRDLGQSPWFALTLLIPMISFVFFFYIGLAKTKQLNN